MGILLEGSCSDWSRAFGLISVEKVKPALQATLQADQMTRINLQHERREMAAWSYIVLISTSQKKCVNARYTASIASIKPGVVSVAELLSIPCSRR